MRRKHRDLLAWQHAVQLVKAVYQLTAELPDSARFGLTPQMRPAAVSVPSNIAEGAARLSQKEFLHFLGIARGSLSEIDTQLVVAIELGHVNDSSALEQNVNDAFGLINGLINSLNRSGNI